MVLLQETALQIVSPLIKLWESFVNIFPGLIAAIIVLILGYFVALLLGHVVRLVLSKLKVDKVMSKVDAPKPLSKLELSSILGQLTKWYIFIIFLGSATELLRLGALSALLAKFVLWLPQLIIAILAAFLGLVVAYYVSHIIVKEAKLPGAKPVAAFFKVVILFIALIIALEQIGIEVDVLKNMFLILIGGIALGAAIALGMSFGQSLKAPVNDFVQSLRSKVKK